MANERQSRFKSLLENERKSRENYERKRIETSVEIERSVEKAKFLLDDIKDLRNGTKALRERIHDSKCLHGESNGERRSYVDVARYGRQDGCLNCGKDHHVSFSSLELSSMQVPTSVVGNLLTQNRKAKLQNKVLLHAIGKYQEAEVKTEDTRKQVVFVPPQQKECRSITTSTYLVADDSKKKHQEEVEWLNKELEEKTSLLGKDFEEKTTLLSKELEEKDSLLKKEMEEKNSLLRKLEENNLLLMKQKEEMEILAKDSEKKDQIIKRCREQEEELKVKIQQLEEEKVEFEKQLKAECTSKCKKWNDMARKRKEKHRKDTRELKEKIRQRDDTIQHLNDQLEEKCAALQQLIDENHDLLAQLKHEKSVNATFTVNDTAACIDEEQALPRKKNIHDSDEMDEAREASVKDLMAERDHWKSKVDELMYAGGSRQDEKKDLMIYNLTMERNSLKSQIDLLLHHNNHQNEKLSKGQLPQKESNLTLKGYIMKDWTSKGSGQKRDAEIEELQHENAAYLEEINDLKEKFEAERKGYLIKNWKGKVYAVKTMTAEKDAEIEFFFNRTVAERKNLQTRVEELEILHSTRKDDSTYLDEIKELKERAEAERKGYIVQNWKGKVYAIRKMDAEKDTEITNLLNSSAAEKDCLQRKAEELYRLNSAKEDGNARHLKEVEEMKERSETQRKGYILKNWKGKLYAMKMIAEKNMEIENLVSSTGAEKQNLHVKVEELKKLNSKTKDENQTYLEEIKNLEERAEAERKGYIIKNWNGKVFAVKNMAAEEDTEIEDLLNSTAAERASLQKRLKELEKINSTTQEESLSYLEKINKQKEHAETECKGYIVKNWKGKVFAIKNISSENENLFSTINELTMERDELKVHVEELEEKLNTTVGEEEELRSKYEAKCLELKRVTQRAVESHKSIAHLQVLLNNHESAANFNMVSERREHLKNEISQVLLNLKNSRTEWKTDNSIQDYTLQIEELKDTCNKQSATLKEVQEKENTSDERVKELESSLGELKEKTNADSEVIAALKEKETSLKSSLKDEQLKNEELSEELAGVMKQLEIERLSEGNESKDVTKLKTKLQEESENYRRSENELMETYAKLDGVNKKFAEEVSTLKQRVEELEQEIESKDEEIKKLKDSSRRPSSEKLMNDTITKLECQVGELTFVKNKMQLALNETASLELKLKEYEEQKEELLKELDGMQKKNIDLLRRLSNSKRRSSQGVNWHNLLNDSSTSSVEISINNHKQDSDLTLFGVTKDSFDFDGSTLPYNVTDLKANRTSSQFVESLESASHAVGLPADKTSKK